jgi:signal recognition particle subunit SRP54
MFESVTNTISSIFTVFSRKKVISERDIEVNIQKIETSLIDSDVPVSVARDFIASIREKLIGKPVPKGENPGDYFLLQLRNTLLQFLKYAEKPFSMQPKEVLLCMGLQGSGKTTTLSKLAYYLLQQSSSSNKKILLASVDFYRPAAIDQLALGADKAGASFYRSEKQTVLEASRDILQHFRSGKYDVLLLDTAGRMHVDQTLLNELREIKNIVHPKQSVLVLDAMLGQESMHIAEQFEKMVGFDGTIITKMDSDTKGGVTFALSYLLKKPIYFVGNGEHVDDLETFHADRTAEKIIGMGDLATLIEEMDKRLKNASLQVQMPKNTFTMDDFAQQLQAMGTMGSLGKLISYLPAHLVPKMSSDEVNRIERNMKRCLAIITSMTKKERVNIALLKNLSRKTRIAEGSGVSVADVDALCAQYREMRDAMKLFKQF